MTTTERALHTLENADREYLIARQAEISAGEAWKRGDVRDAERQAKAAELAAEEVADALTSVRRMVQYAFGLDAEEWDLIACYADRAEEIYDAANMCAEGAREIANRARTLCRN